MQAFQGMYLAAWITALIVLVILTGFLAASLDGPLDIFGFYVALSVGLAAALATAVAGLATVEAIDHGSLSRSFLLSDLESGRFSLRIVSFLAAYKAIRSLWISFTTTADYGESNFPQFSSLRPERARDNVAMLAASQFCIYLASSMLLWIVYISDVSQSVWILLLSWSMFFVVDDWNLVADYLVPLRGRILRSHLIRIETFNLLIAVSAVVVAWQQFHWWGALASSIFMLCVGLIHIAFLGRDNIPGTKTEGAAAAVDPADAER